MYPKKLLSAELFALLFRIDEEEAARTRARGCPRCGGRLHTADYQRKPRGWALPERYGERFSLCCGREGCRRRVTPSSRRFDGRRVYWRAIVLVAVAARQSRCEGVTAGELCRLLGMCRQTLKRWLTWFRDEFERSDGWRRIRGQVSAEVAQELPLSLVKHAGADEQPSQLVKLLCLLAGVAPEHGR